LDNISRFSALFRGSQLSHGLWSKEQGAKTELTPPSAEDYTRHVEGLMGLGVVPVTEEGTCWFGAIDIDVDTTDHAALLKEVRAKNFPLNVCRSKSGGAHLYLFTKDPVKAEVVIRLLKKFAGLLGYPRVETFPKQAKVGGSNLGSWINLPYFSGDNTTRYCLGSEGPYSLAEFLDNIVWFDHKAKFDESVKVEDLKNAEMPPCLRKLTEEGMPEGTRNQGILNVAMFFKKSDPNAWRDKLKEYNAKCVSKPLAAREIITIGKSAGQHQYHYTCLNEPLASRCDRTSCLKLPFGVGFQEASDASNFDDMQVRNLRKLQTDPPRYLVEVNGTDLELDTDDLRNYNQGFRKRAFEVLDIVIANKPQNKWELELKDLLMSLQVLEAPADASPLGAVMDKVQDFLSKHDRARGIEDVLKGIPFQENDYIIFRGSDLQKDLQQAKHMLQFQELYQLLRRVGTRHEIRTIKGRKINLWKFPAKEMNVQTEDFDKADFPEKPKEEM
jgi:hypothetical protein